MNPYSKKHVKQIINLFIKVMIGESLCFIYGVFVVNLSNFTIFGKHILNIACLTLVQRLKGEFKILTPYINNIIFQRLLLNHNAILFHILPYTSLDITLI